jgi:hypothetical protein
MAVAPAAQPQVSEGMKILFYILSFLIPIIGIIIGIIYYTKPDPESKNLGKMCLLLALVGILIGVVCNFAVLGSMWL